jgi:hypothetical protein
MYSNSKEQVSLEEAYKMVHTEEFDSLVDLGQQIVQNDNPSQVKSELAKWADAIGDVLGDSKLDGNNLMFNDQYTSADFISNAMSNSTFGDSVEEIEQDLKSDDIQILKKAHNKKVNLLRFLDKLLIRKAVKMGLLEDDTIAFKVLQRDVDRVKEEVEKIERM